MGEEDGAAAADRDFDNEKALDEDVARLHPRRWADARARVAALRLDLEQRRPSTNFAASSTVGQDTKRVGEVATRPRGGLGVPCAPSRTSLRLPDRLPAEVVALVDEALDAVLAADRNATPSDLVHEVARRCSSAGLPAPSRLTLTRRLARRIEEAGGRAAAASMPATPLANLVVDRAALEIATITEDGSVTIPLVAFVLDEATGVVLAHALMDEGPWISQAATVVAAALRSVPAFAIGAVTPATVLTDRTGPSRTWRTLDAALARFGTRLLLRDARSPATGTLVARTAGPRIAGIPLVAQRHLAGREGFAARTALARTIGMEPVPADELPRMIAAAASVHNQHRTGSQHRSPLPAREGLAERVAAAASELESIAARER